MNIHIPTYEEVYAKSKTGDRSILNPLEAFIYTHEPIFTETGWRADLHSLIEYVLRKEDK